MKKLLITISLILYWGFNAFLFLSPTTLAFAQPKTVTITFTDENDKVIDEQTLNEAETKSAQTIMMSIPEWTLNSINNRARIAQDRVVTQSGKGSQFTPKAEKDKIVNDLIKEDKLKTAKEKKEERKLELK